jgi:hypothetical protein
LRSHAGISTGRSLTDANIEITLSMLSVLNMEMIWGLLSITQIAIDFFNLFIAVDQHRDRAAVNVGRVGETDGNVVFPFNKIPFDEKPQLAEFGNNAQVILDLNDLVSRMS